MDHQTIYNLIDQPLPGVEGQNIMLPHPSRNNFELPSTYKEASVMILLFEIDTVWKFVLIKRAYNPKDKHSGQIGLPGGKLEKNESIKECAIRECVEEIGAKNNMIEYICPITSLYVPASGYMVYPHIAIYTGDTSQFVKQESEVAEIITMPIDTLMDESIITTQNVKILNNTLNNVPTYNYQSHTIWGATAMILSELKQLLLLQ